MAYFNADKLDEGSEKNEARLQENKKMVCQFLRCKLLEECCGKREQKLFFR